MNISDKVKSLKPSDLNCNVFDVYTYDGLSMQELLCQFFTKINECIKVSNETIDLATWLVNEGLKIEVVNKLMLWLEDGTLENLINVNLFNTLHTKIENIDYKNTINKQIKVNNNEEFLTALKSNLYDKIILNKGEIYEINEELTINITIDGNFSRVNVKKPFKTNSNTKLINIDFNGLNNTNHCILLSGGAYIEKCQFYSFDTAIKQNGTCVHTKIIDNVFGYNKNGIVLDCEDDYSCNNFIIERNYFVKNGNNVDDLSANGTETGNVGVGLLLECGCNRVEVINNVFEYNSFCGVLMSLTNNSKTNDSVIVNNYFEGNKITGIMVNKTSNISNCQYNIKDNYYSQRMTTNSDWVNNDIIARGTPSSFYPVLNQKNKSVLFGGGTNVVNNEKDNFMTIGSSQYLSFAFDRVPSTELNSYKVLLSYHSKLDSNVELRSGDASSTIKQFTTGEVKESVIVDVKSGINKYMTRKLNDNEFIRIYGFNLLT